MSRSGWESFSVVREWSGGSVGCPVVVGRPSQMSGSGQEALLSVRQLSGVSPGCPGVVGRPCRLSGSCGRPSRMSRSCRWAFPKLWEASPELREWS